MTRGTITGSWSGEIKQSDFVDTKSTISATVVI